MVHVTGRHHELDVNGLCHLAHRSGDGLLVVVAVAAQVVGNVEVERLLQGLEVLQDTAVRDNTAAAVRERRLILFIKLSLFY